MRFLLLTTTLLLASCAEADASADLTACGVDDAERERLMALSLDDFDQDFDGGWRDVSNRDGCKGAAVTLLRDYIDIHDLDPEEHNVVFWHVGQLLAGEGDYEAAKVYFQQSHNANAKDFHERAWSTYAQGTIAFIDGDRAGLDAAIAELSRDEYKPDAERVAQMERTEREQGVSFPEGAKTKPLNLIALEGLRNCFGQPYSQAYGRCNISK